MQTSLLYGKGELTIELPDDAFVVEPPCQPALDEPRNAVRAALAVPIGTPPLKEMVRADDRVAFVISDITRPTPNHVLVPSAPTACPATVSSPRSWPGPTRRERY